MTFSAQEDSPFYEIYSNASWKLEPLLDDYVIYLDDYTITNHEQSVADIESLDLYKMVDRTTGKAFTYSLFFVNDNDAVLENARKNSK